MSHTPTQTQDSSFGTDSVVPSLQDSISAITDCILSDRPASFVRPDGSLIQS